MPAILKSTSISETPKDAVLLSRTDAADYIFDSILDLGILEALPYRGGYAALALMSGMSSMFTISKIRKFFKVGRYGFITTALPAAYVPMIGSYVAYKTVIAPPILLQENICFTCLEVKAMAIQLGIGIIYPFFASYAITYQIASSLGTYQAPRAFLLKQAAVRKEMANIFKQVIMKLASPLVKISICHCALACGVLSLQLYRLDDTLEAIEKKRQDNIDEIIKLDKEKKHKAQQYSKFVDVI